MNKKEKSIKQLAGSILSHFDSHGIKIMDFWEGDLCAIGFSDDAEDKLVYVSTYNRKYNRFYVSLGKVAPGNSPKTEIIYEDIDYIQLQRLIVSHLISSE